MKTCKTCKIEKELTEFGKHKQCRFGVSNKCKACTKIHAANYYLLNREKLLIGDKKYREANSEKISERKKIYRKSNPEKIKERRHESYLKRKDKEVAYNKKWAIDNKDKCKLAHKKWDLLNLKKRKAITKFNNAVMRGKIKREPCEICGNVQSHGHHDDYNYPLVVRFLCPMHHAEWHFINGEGLNGK